MIIGIDWDKIEQSMNDQKLMDEQNRKLAADNAIPIELQLKEVKDALMSANIKIADLEDKIVEMEDQLRHALGID